MKIFPIPILQDNYVWTLCHPEKNLALIVDPGAAEPVVAALQQHGLILAGILLTHHHWDHTNGVKALKALYPVPVFGPKQDSISECTVAVGEADSITLTDFPFSARVIAIPGHTVGHIAYYAPYQLFCGDTLFSAGCGRAFEGPPATLYASLQKIAALPDATKIYCAHEYTLNNLRFAAMVEPHNPAIEVHRQHIATLRQQGLPSLPTTLATEKEINPFLRCNQQEIKENVEKYAGTTLSTPVEVFTWLRKWKDAF